MVDTTKSIQFLERMLKETRPTPHVVSAEVTVNSEKVAEDCVDRMREVYAVMKAAYMEMHNGVAVVEGRAQDYDSSKLVDCVFAAKETKKLAEELVKELNGMLRQLQRTICLRWLPEADADHKIRGNFADGYPRVRREAVLPKFEKDPVEYNKVCEWLGIPEDLRDKGRILVVEGEFYTKVVELSYVGFNHLIERYEHCGIGLPDFITNAKWGFIETYDVATRRSADLL
jgi:hypothetical protein